MHSLPKLIFCSQLFSITANIIPTRRLKKIQIGNSGKMHFQITGQDLK